MLQLIVVKHHTVIEQYNIVVLQQGAHANMWTTTTSLQAYKLPKKVVY